MSEETETTPLSGGVDEIAGLLAGISDETEETTDDLDSSEKTTDESTDVGESNEEEEQTEESEEEGESDETENEGDTTWSSVLGIEDSNIVLNEEGDFKGVNIKVDGESDTVDIKSLIAGYQTNKHNTNTSQNLAKDRKEFENIRDGAVQVYTKKLDDITKLSEYMGNTLMQEYNSIDWNALRQTDPAEYAAASQDFQKRQQDIKNIHEAIESERIAELDITNKSSQENLNKRNMVELDKVKANNPAWDTDAKLVAAFDELGGFVNETYGVTREEFNTLGNANYIEVMKDAMAYRKGKKTASKKLVGKKLPKYLKSKKSSKTTKSVSKLDKLTKAANSAQGGDKRGLQLDAVAELLNGG